MTVNRDKLGEFILVPESFNRYEVFAPPGSANWVSLSEATGAGTTHSAILFRQQLPAASTEKRVLIHSDQIGRAHV